MDNNVASKQAPNNTSGTPMSGQRSFYRNRRRSGENRQNEFNRNSSNSNQGQRQSYSPETDPRRSGGQRNQQQGSRQRSGGQNRGRRFGNNRNGFARNQNSGNQRRRSSRFPDQRYETANAADWNNIGSYKFNGDASEKLRLIPISGVEMVGTNCTVLEYGDDIIIIDAGLGFPGEDLTGIDALVPNLSYLADKLDKVRGLIITHGHTDHIGGLHHIYDKIGFPQIYAPRLAAEMIREKMKETPFAGQVKVQEIDGDSDYYLGKFKISHFRMNHTIMDNYGVVIDTPVGKIVTPSDYKFDLNPYKESPSDYSKLTKLGDEGVLLLMDESTNVRLKGWAPSETAIAKDLENTIRDAQGRLIIGMFSTMISRIRQVVELADRYGKKIVILGRSLDTNVKISHKLGYIDVLNSVFIAPEEMKNIPDDKIVVLTTGSQGEANAALMRMALGEHHKITLKPSDTVVFSSSRIPGNEGKIDKLINLIAEKGCRILTNEHLTLHASGHGCEEDHKLMLHLVKPKFLMPIHGEPRMLTANKELAKTLGYKDEQVILTHDGSVVELWSDGWEIKERIESTPLWVEGNRVGEYDRQMIVERKVLTDEGSVILTVKNVDSKEISLNDIELISAGFFHSKQDTYLKNELTKAVVEQVNRMPAGSRDKETVKAALRRFVENELTRQYDKKPLVVVSVL